MKNHRPFDYAQGDEEPYARFGEHLIVRYIRFVPMNDRMWCAVAQMKDWAIAIDGPAGVGKSTVAKEVAKILGAPMLDTGAIYRAVGIAVLSAGLNPNSAEDCAIVLPECCLEINSAGLPTLCGEDVPQFLLRGAMGSKASSEVAQHGVVRDFLLETQRNTLGAQPVIVAEGRDIGTVVFPNAMCKFFLDADESIRKQRIIGKLLGMGKSRSEAESAAAGVTARDERDRGREIAPLKPADDAVIVDTSGMDSAAVVDLICEAFWTHPNRG